MMTKLTKLIVVIFHDVWVYQNMKLCALNIDSFCQLHLNKTEEKNKIGNK